MIDDIWNTISEEAKDFIKLLINIQPKQRLNAQQALKHPWFQKTLQN